LLGIDGEPGDQAAGGILLSIIKGNGMVQDVLEVFGSIGDRDVLVDQLGVRC
jgi:hypothetical protein